MGKVGRRVAYEFVVSEIGLKYWCVWWSALAGPTDGAMLRCEVIGPDDVKAAIKEVRSVAKELNIGLPGLQRKGRNTT